MSAVPLPGAALTFLRELRTTGAPIIHLHGRGPSPGGLELFVAGAAQDPGLLPLLKSWHREASEDLGGPPLAFDEPAARHGATLLLRAAWFYLHRDSDAATVTRFLAEPAPCPSTAAAQFSADQTLQHLPALFRMAQALAPGDPLLEAFHRLAHLWPLSGIGIPPGQGDAPPSADSSAWTALGQHPGLWQLFLDRLLQSPASRWLQHPGVAMAIRHNLGAYARELAPTISLPTLPLELPRAPLHPDAPP